MTTTLSATAIGAMDIRDVAEWYAANQDDLEAAASALRRAAGRLREAIRDSGPIQTTAGKLSLGADLMKWAPETANEFPVLGKHVVEVTVGTLAEAEQIIEVSLEQIPTARVAHNIKVEALLANAFQKVATPEQAARLAELRTANGKLVVAP